MTISWVLESNVFSEKCFDEMIAHFRANAIPFATVKIIPFVHEIDGAAPSLTNPVVVYGSIGTQKLARRMGWTPGVFGSVETFSETLAKENLGDLYLNADQVHTTLSGVPDVLSSGAFPDGFFLKPNTDTKAFAGAVLDADEFGSWYANMISIGYLEENDFPVVMSQPKKLGCEWRVVVVDGKISDASIYRQYRTVKPERHVIPEVVAVVEEANRRYQPAPVYVIDVAQVWLDDEWDYRIIEYNTFNSAGLYACDVGKIIDDVNAYVETAVEKV